MDTPVLPESLHPGGGARSRLAHQLGMKYPGSQPTVSAAEAAGFVANGAALRAMLEIVVAQEACLGQWRAAFPLWSFVLLEWAEAGYRIAGTRDVVRIVICTEIGSVGAQWRGCGYAACPHASDDEPDACRSAAVEELVVSRVDCLDIHKGEAEPPRAGRRAPEHHAALAMEVNAPSPDDLRELGIAPLEYAAWTAARQAGFLVFVAAIQRARLVLNWHAAYVLAGPPIPPSQPTVVGRAATDEDPMPTTVRRARQSERKASGAKLEID